MTLHIVSWNVENLAPYLAGDASVTLRDVLERVGQPDVLCLQEVRVRSRDFAMDEAMRGALPGYRCHASLNRDERNGNFRGGRAYGVATWTRVGLRAAARTFDWDREGRIAVTLLPGLRWAVLNVYAVNGTPKAYWDHECGRIDRDRHAFKRRFIRRLGDEALGLRKEGFELILIGDGNISRSRMDTWPRMRTEEPHAIARAEFNDVFIPRLDLVDVFRALHPGTRKYTWFNRRSKAGRLDAARVDYALLGASLMPRVDGAGIEDMPARPHTSDHASVWVRLRRAPCLS